MADEDQIPITKETLFAHINHATSMEDLDAVEEIATGIGYKPNGILLRTLAERRGNFAKAARGTTGGKK